MRDVQNETEGFPHIPINDVGVDGIKALLHIASGREATSSILATFSATCSLSAMQRGLNMSRTARTIYAYLQEIGDTPLVTLEDLSNRLMQAHNTQYVAAHCSFDYPFPTAAPITAVPGIKCVRVTMQCNITRTQNISSIRNTLAVTTREMSLCPCSQSMSLLSENLSDDEKKIIATLPAALQQKINNSGLGAHNQTVDITAEVSQTQVSGTHSTLPTINTLYSLLSSCASAVTYPALKRDDEKYTTEYASSHPRFVEDIARIAASKLNLLDTLSSYTVSVKSNESIHSNGIAATARIEWQNRNYTNKLT